MLINQLYFIPRFLLFLSLVISGFPIDTSAEDTLNSRPKIGVALSGGGARGIAHLGALQALAELRVPIDYIAGTSMGSIVGGLYASGLSVEELHRAVEEINWEKVFNLKIDRKQLSYREKQNQRRFFQIEIGLNNNNIPTVPPGVVGGQNLFLELKRLTRGIDTDDFDKLPIPFKAVAVDVNTAETYWLEKGDLALALRASMAVPLAFAPVEIDGRLLVDGGVLNNLPVDVVTAMGADIVIAINISAPLNEIQSSASFLAVASQSLDVALIQNTRRALENADIVITPDLQGYGFTDFSQGTEMIKKGYEAVIEKSALFAGIQISPTAYAHYRQQLANKTPKVPEYYIPDTIKFTGHQRTNTATLQGQLNELKGKELSIGDIEQEIKQLMSLNDFEQITYNIVKEKSGQTGLIFNVREKSWGPSYFRLGLNARTRFDDKAEFTALLRHEKLNINRFGAEWITELSFGSGYGLFTEFYQPLDYRRRFFIAPYTQFRRFFTDVFEQQHGIAEYDLENWHLGTDFGINFGNRAELRTGFLHNYLKAQLRIGESEQLPTGRIQENLLTFQFGYDSLDDRAFPRRGTRIDIEGEVYDKSISSNSDFQKMAFSIRQVVPLTRWLTLMADADFFTFFRSTPPSYENFSLGGINYLAGYPESDIGGKQALFLQLAGILNSTGWADMPSISSTDFRLVGFLHAGNAWDNYEDISLKDLLVGGLGAVVWDTQFGSLLLGTGYTKGGSLNYYLSLGNLF